MTEDRLTRRQFVRDTAAGAAALAAGVSLPNAVKVGNAEQVDTRSILNYNADMEYRRCGKTNWMVSAVCLGGHWKRVDLMAPGIFRGGSWNQSSEYARSADRNYFKPKVRRTYLGFRVIKTR